MNKIFYTLILITIVMNQIQAQTTDLQLIEKTVNYYFDGMVNHKSESFLEAFHPTATMKWIGEEYTEVNAVEALSGYVESNPTVKTMTRILAINVIGDAANVQLELEYETFSFIDFMHLLKINGEWKIVSKIYTKRPKEFKE